MGTYTTNLKLYKPAETEFVDPETQLNRNWDITDSSVRRLLEYEFTDLAVPPTTDTLSRSRFYKEYSNSIPTYFGPPSNFFYEDPGAYVSTWNSGADFLNPLYTPHPDFELRYRTIESTFTSTKEVEWSGAVWLGGGNLPLNTTVSILADIPAAIRPTTAKYFTMSAGNTATNYSFCRIIFVGGSVEYRRYGDAAGASADQNIVEFTGIKYNVEVTGA